MIYFTSDTHFCHNRPFLYEPRGFKSIEEHDETIVTNWNSIVKPEDEVYHLGDVMLIDNEKGIKYLKSLNGKIHLILGYFFLCHYPVLVHNYDDYKKIWNIHGHTHSKEKFSENMHCYNACLDAHDNYPVSLERILEDVQNKKMEMDRNNG